ncbi:hypothetical protein CHH67_02210, partial [Paenibacillus campinasensis]
MSCLTVSILGIHSVSAAPDNGLVVDVSPDEPKDIGPPTYTPDASKGPTAYQKRIRTVQGQRESNPGVYWFQIADGRFAAESYRAPGGFVYVANIGTASNGYPAIGEVRDKIEMKSNPIYQPHGYVDYSGLPVPKSSLTNERLTRVETVPLRQGVESNITKLEITDLKTAVLITSQTGKVGPSSSDLYQEFRYEDTGERPWNDACSCFLPWTVKKFGFYTPLNLFWLADEVEQKRIEVKGKTSLAVGEETDLQALVSTIAPGETDYKNPVNVASRDQTTWSSDKSSVVSLVNDSGRVKANSPGTAKITAVWKSDENNGYILTASITITVGGAPTPDPDPPTAACTPPSPGTKINGRYMDPVVTAKI